MPADIHQPLVIEASPESLAPGDLRVRISGNTIYIPSAAADEFSRHGVRTAADMLSYLEAYPSAVGSAFGWSDQDVAAAANRLRTELKGKVSDSLLSPEQRTTPPLGARNPADKPPQQ